MISSAHSTSSGKKRYFGNGIGSRTLLALAALLLICPTSRAQRLHVSDLQATPKKITLKWDPSPQGPWSPPSQNPANPMTPTTVGVGSYWNKLNRTPSGPGLPYSFTTQTTFDNTNWSANTQYEYWLSGFDVYYTKTYNSTNGTWYWAGPSVTPKEWPRIFLSVQAIGVNAVATADSRLDMRFATERLLDYTFNAIPAAAGGGVSLYRGGLFAGFQQDGSRVGRTYLKFSGLVPAPGAGIKLWPIAGLQVYVPRLGKTGSMSLTTRVLTDESFSPSSLVWSNAPTMGSSTARSAMVSWSAGSPAGQWVSINVTPDIEAAATTDNTLALSVMSGNEAAAGWAYFARPTFTDPTYTLPANSLTPPNGLGPYLLFGLFGPGVNLSSLTVSPTSVTSGSSTIVTGTVTIPSLAPPNGFEVSLASNNSAASVPGSVIIPEGQSSASFPVTWSSVTTATTATITGVLGNSRTATLTINPGSGGGGGGGGGTGILDSLSLSAGGVPAGTSVTGTITLSAPAPTGGRVVNLTSGNTNAAQVPASVTVLAGQTTRTFTITTGPGFAYYQPVTITATSGTSTRTASLFVYPGGPGGPGGPPGGGL